MESAGVLSRNGEGKRRRQPAPRGTRNADRVGLGRVCVRGKRRKASTTETKAKIENDARERKVGREEEREKERERGGVLITQAYTTTNGSN